MTFALTRCEHGVETSVARCRLCEPDASWVYDGHVAGEPEVLIRSSGCLLMVYLLGSAALIGFGIGLLVR